MKKIFLFLALAVVGFGCTKEPDTAVVTPPVEAEAPILDVVKDKSHWTALHNFRLPNPNKPSRIRELRPKFTGFQGTTFKQIIERYEGTQDANLNLT